MINWRWDCVAYLPKFIPMEMFLSHLYLSNPSARSVSDTRDTWELSIACKEDIFLKKILLGYPLTKEWKCTKLPAIGSHCRHNQKSLAWEGPWWLPIPSWGLSCGVGVPRTLSTKSEFRNYLFVQSDQTILLDGYIMNNNDFINKYS